MKKKIFLMLALALMLSCLFVISASAQVTTYDDAPERSKIQIKEDEIIEFNDGFKCPSAYVFKDVTSITDGGSFEGVMSFDYINGKTDKTYTFADVKGFDIPSGFTYIGKYAGKDERSPSWVTFPNTVTSFGAAIFQNSSTLEYCEMKFDETNPQRQFPPYMFCSAEKLQAFSMPDCFTEIHDKYTFTSCTALKAVYLSENLTTWNSGGGGTGGGTFDYCGNMYFVNESFSLKEVPAKPDVYYFPANLQSRPSVASDFSVQSTMRNCSSINSIIVFGENVTSFSNEYFLQSSTVKIVFLGDMTAAAMGNGNWYKTTYYFANEADKSTDDVTISTYSASKAVFCNAEGNTTHLADPKKTQATPATCVDNEIEATYCFCGASVGTTEVEGTKLGHNHDLENGATLVGIEYADFAAEGNKVVKCSRCDVEDKAQAVAAIFGTTLLSLKDDNTAICVTYTINNDAYSAFLAANEGASLEFGLVAAASLTDEIADPLNSTNISYDLTKGGYSAVDLKLTGDWATQSGVFISMALYTSYTAGEGAEAVVNYVTNDGSSAACEAVTYQELYEYYYSTVTNN